MTEQQGLGRRPFLTGGGALFGALIAQARPAGAESAARRETLVVGLDLNDTTALDPGQVTSYSSPMPTRAAYDPLVTMAPGDYITLRPCVAKEWSYLPDGKTLRFKLRDDVVFASGNPVTAEDVRFSFTRLVNLGYQASQYVAHVDHVVAVDPLTVDFVLKDPTQPLATILAAPEYGVTEKAVVVQHGGTDAPNAHDTDTATPWLNENSVGSGPYRLVGWQHNQQVQMVRNPRYWTSPKPGYQRLLIRHMSDGATQLLALTHGDLDAAFNLTAEQAATLKGNPEINVVRNQSLDYLYMAVAEAPDNPALQKQQARQAIGYAIDYDGIINGLAGGFAVRPAAFLPVGVNGSTAELTKQIGYHQDLARARQLLADTGLPEGFGFRLHYPSNAILAGVAYSDVAQKLQSDLAKVNIKVELAPTDLVNMYTLYTTGRVQAALGFWNPPAVENQLWASATVVRVAKRVHWNVPPEFNQLVHDAGAERDLAKAAVLWRKYQEQMVGFAHLFVLIQPIYQVGIRKSVAGLNVTAAGWLAEFNAAKPA